MVADVTPASNVGKHDYGDDDGTTDCKYGCGCWMGPFRSGGPDGIDPFGTCPKNPAGVGEQSEAPRASAENSCPCRWTTPCADRCSCAVPASSSGCLRCCRYGSDAQRRERAQAIVAAEKALQRIATFGNHVGPSDEAVIARAAIDNAKATSVTAVNAEERCAACGSPNVVFESPAEGYWCRNCGATDVE